MRARRMKAVSGDSPTAAINDPNRGNGSSLDLEPIHGWFELSYAQYLTIPRSVLQSMPQEWQARFVRCLCELDEAIDWRPTHGTYRVELRDLRDDYTGGEFSRKWGRLIADPLRDYERGRRRLSVKNVAKQE